MRNSRQWSRFVLGFAVLTGLGLTALATHHGIGVTHDSVTYLEGATEIRDGRGFRLSDLPGEQGPPITRYPPFFAAAVAAISAVTSTPVLDAARALQLGCLALNVSLAWWLVRRYTGSPPVAAGAALLTASSPTMLEVHTAAWSEPLFLLLTGGALAATCVYVETGKRHMLLGGGGATGLGQPHSLRLAAVSSRRFACGHVKTRRFTTQPDDRSGGLRGAQRRPGDCMGISESRRRRQRFRRAIR